MGKDEPDVNLENTAELRVINERLRLELAERQRIAAELKARARQQAAVAELGQRALVGTSLSILMDEVVQLVSETLELDFSIIFELDEASNSLLSRAGLGWSEAQIDSIMVAVDNRTQPGYTLNSHGPVIVENHAQETRFDPLPLFREHSVISSLSVLIQGRDRPYGVLGAHAASRRIFTEDDIHFLQSVANVLAMAIERKRAETQILQRNRALLTLQSAGAAVASSLDLQYVLDTVSQELADLLPVEACLIYEWDWNARTISPVVIYGPEELREETAIGERHDLTDYPLIEQVLVERSPRQFTISQPDIDPAEKTYMEAIGLVTLLILPLVFQNQVIGLAELSDRQTERTFSEQEIALAQLLANQAASAIENARLFAETRKMLREQMALRDAGTAISSTLDLEGVLSHIAEQMGQVAEVTGVRICNFEPETMMARVLAEYFSARVKSPGSNLGATYHLPSDFPSIVEFLQGGQPRLLHLNDPELTETEAAHMHQFGIQTILTIPMQFAGQVIAYAELWQSDLQRDFTSEEIGLCQGIAQQAAIAIENARLFIQTQNALDETATLYRVARALAQMDDEAEMYEFVLTEYLSYLNLEQGGVLIMDSDKTYGTLRAHMVNGELVEPGLRLRVADNPSYQRLIDTNQPVVINDARQDALIEPVRDVTLELGIISLLLVPIAVRGQVIGALGADSTNEVYKFSDREISLVKAMASQLGIAIENTRLTDETERRAMQLTVLHEMDRAITQNLGLDDIYYVFARHAIRLLDYDYMSVILLRDEELSVAYTTGQVEIEANLTIGSSLPLKGSASGRAILQGQPLLRHTISSRSHFLEDKNLAAAGIQSMMILPLWVKGEVIGTWNIGRCQVGAYTPDDLEIGQAMAEQLAVTIENARLYHEIHQYLEEVTTLNMISQVITSTLDLQEMLTIITQHTIDLLDVEAASVALVDEATHELWFAAASGLGSENIRERRLSYGQGVIGWVIEQGEPVLVPDVTKSDRFFDQFDQEGDFTTRSILSVPLQTRGQTIGAIEAMNKAGIFNQDDLRLLSSLASLAAGGIENARLFKKAQQEISERKRAETALQDSIERLEMSNKQARVYAQELNAEIGERKRAEMALEEERSMLAQRVAERTADLKAANEELARAARLKDEFLASMSHELRTPLSAILGLTEVLRGEIYGALNEKQLKSLSSIEESGRHLLSLINDILDLSKIGAGKLELQVDRVPVASICQASLRMIKDAANKKQINVSSTLDTRVSILQADERRLKQILVNLLSNAVKFTSEGGAIGLEVTGDPSREEVDFIVWDTGIGIPAEDVEKLFQPFVQLNTGLARQYPGTGLGLALVQRMAELHDGRIKVESEVDQGSRFTVTLPWVGQPQPGEPVELDEAGLSIESDAPEAAPDSLTATDEPPASQPIPHYLSELGIETVIQAGADEALQTAKKVKPDIIILDDHSQTLVIDEILAQFKEDQHTQDTPILIVSGPDEAELDASVEAVLYLSGPASSQELDQAMTQILGRGIKDAVQTVLIVDAPQTEKDSARSDGDGPLVLLVEDDRNLTSFMMNYLVTKQYRVIVAWNGRDGIELARQEKPDIILMDVQMPEMDGLEATRRIRADSDPQVAAIPIIALTALAMSGDRERCLEAGANHYLSKPIKLRDLAQAINLQLNKKQITEKG